MSYQLPTRRLVSQDDAAMVARPDIPRSTFLGSFSIKTTFDQGFLIPFHVEECYPGDHFKYQFTPFVRTATPFLPIMDSLRLDIHCFFVPNRLVWFNWTKLMGEQTNPGDSIAFSVPQITSTGNGFAVGQVGDQMGLPAIGQPSQPITVNALPFRCYNRIWNTWYRDENLQAEATELIGDGASTEVSYPLRRRNKSHDYFTSCLPWPQKFVAPTVPIGGSAPVKGLAITTGIGTNGVGNPPGTKESIDVAPSGWTGFVNVPAANLFIRSNSTTFTQPNVFADLTAATGIDINTFRQAMQIQVFLERMARGGTRYTEITQHIFGVRNPDARLQRPEYIGGGSTPVQFTPVAQTAPVAGVGLGVLGGAGTAVGNNTASYACTEHGFIICLASVKAELSYSQGVHKMWDRKTLYDYYNPAFAGLGEQAVRRRELFATGVPANDDFVFGYQERWHELRTDYSRVSGAFRPTTTPNIDEWHFSQALAAPTLGSTFIEDSAPMSRVLQGGANTNQQFLADIHVRKSATRPLPVFGTPVGLGRF